MSTRRPGWPTSWPGSPIIPPTVSTSYCRGTGSRARHRKVRQPDRGGDRIRLHDRLRRQPARRGRRLAARAVDRHVPRRRRLWIYGVGEDGVTAFTEDGIENLRQIIVDERTAGRAPPSIKPAK